MDRDGVHGERRARPVRRAPRARAAARARRAAGDRAGAARGLRFLHAKDVVHRDVKAANILIDEHGVAKLADFGLSKAKAAFTAASVASGDGVKGTITHLSPEILDEDFEERRPYSTASDVYALGIAFYELFSDEALYKGLAPDRMERFVLEQKRPPDCAPLRADAPPALAELLKEMWAHEPSARPAAAAVATRLDGARRGEGPRAARRRAASSRWTMRPMRPVRRPPRARPARAAAAGTRCARGSGRTREARQVWRGADRGGHRGLRLCGLEEEDVCEFLTDSDFLTACPGARCPCS